MNYGKLLKHPRNSLILLSQHISLFFYDLNIHYNLQAIKIKLREYIK